MSLDAVALQSRPFPSTTEMGGETPCRCGWGAALAAPGGIACIHEFRRARQAIYLHGETADDVIFICEGWACRHRQLSDGRRQILSILLPGDVIAAAALFVPSFDFSVQALTDVRYGRIGRNVLWRQFALDEYRGAFSRLMAAERQETDAHLIDLGRRSAEERIAGLVLRLRERLLARGEADGGGFAWPLRQQHVADITGLTPEHVSRVVGQLRKAGIVDLAEGRVAIHNLPELQRIGDAR